MKLLAVVLIMLTAPAAALANGAPCGEPPKLENADAARVIGQTVSADLGTAPVEAPFINRARKSIADLIKQYGLSRAQVVELYVFHICEALYARGTGPGELSQSLSRMKQALAEPAPQPDAETPAPEGESSGKAAKEDDAPETVEPRAGTTEKAPQQQSGVSQGQGNAAAIRKAPKAANRGNQRALSKNLQSRSQSSTGQASKQNRASRPAPSQSQGMITQFGAGGGGGGTATGGRGGGAATGAGQGQGNIAGRTNVPNARISREPANAPRIAQPEAPSASGASEPSAENAPEPAAPQPMAAMRAPATLTDTEERDDPASMTQAQPQDDGATATSPEAAAPPSEDAAGMSAGDAPETAAVQPDAPEETAQASDTGRAEALSEVADAVSSAEDDAVETEGAGARASTAATAASRSAQAGNGACPERGVLGPECLDVDAALERLRDRPVEYNHPPQMIRGQATEIILVLRTDFTEDGLPEETSEAFERLQGEVKQQRAKISNIMSARLRGRDFEVDPKGMQERTITWRRPVEWSWYVTPEAGGEGKRLELELYAHIVNPQGETQPPVLIKTLDATIDVDVRTLDWLIEQARTFEPIYAIAAAIIGFFTALITLWLRRRPAHPGDGPPSGITTASAPPDRRISDMSASEAAADAARKGQDDSGGNGRA